MSVCGNLFLHQGTNQKFVFALSPYSTGISETQDMPLEYLSTDYDKIRCIYTKRSVS